MASGKTEFECDNCGGAFERYESSIQSENKFCSTECYGEWISENKSGKDSHHWEDRKGVECENCGSVKEVRQNYAEKYEMFFCGDVCRSEYLSNEDSWISGESNNRWDGGTVKLECEWCGGEFESKQSQVNRRKTCSVECGSKLRMEEIDQTGENNPHWKGGYDRYYGPSWKNQRRNALNRDQHRCQNCGLTSVKLGREPDVHHKEPFRKFGVENHTRANRLENLISLCQRCHRLCEENPNEFEAKA